jgi:hypothetical protein
MSKPIRIHPENSKLFLFRERPLVLLTATEHYGAVMNRPFRFERYLDDAASLGITLTRLFTLFRELQSAINPYSTCKPETTDYIAPYERTGPDRALDKELRYDLDKPNEEFYERLHRFLSHASKKGIVVEIVLLSNTYNDDVWSLNPLNDSNNINGLEPIKWPEYMSLRHTDVFERQKAHVRRIVEETNRYDNVLYEVCNEPGGNFSGESPTTGEVNEWLDMLIRVIRDTESRLPNRHLIAGQEAFSYAPWEQPADRSFGEMDYDVVNMHPLPNTTFGGGAYHMGDFMSKQLKLRQVRDFGIATYGERKPLNQDEDNVASQYKDPDGWTIHRKRAWMTLMTGNHYDYIDFSILPRRETGTPDSRACIRSWMAHLSTFMHSLDPARSRPLPDLVKSVPPGALEACFGIVDECVAVYLADERELPAARDLPSDEQPDPAAGTPIAGEIILDLPPGPFGVSVFDPKSGLYSPAVRVEGGAGAAVDVPAFVHDTVMVFRRTGV